MFVLDNKMSTSSLNEGLGDWGGGGQKVERQGKGFLNQLAAEPRMGGWSQLQLPP